MIHTSDLFLNRLSLIVYAILLSAAILITWLRVRHSILAVTFNRLVLSLFVTLLALSLFTIAIGFVLFDFLVIAGSTLTKGSLGVAGLLLILGPALCGVLALMISIYPASLVSRLFWPARPGAKIPASAPVQ